MIMRNQKSVDRIVRARNTGTRERVSFSIGFEDSVVGRSEMMREEILKRMVSMPKTMHARQWRVRI